MTSDMQEAYGPDREAARVAAGGSDTSGKDGSGFPVLADVPESVDKKVLYLISEEAARKYRMAAFDRSEGVVKVAMVNPHDLESLNVLRFLAEKEKVEIDVYVASDEVFEGIASRYSDAEKALKEAVLSFKDEDGVVREAKVKKTEKKAVESKEVFQDTPITKLVRVVLKHAVDGRASDIHIEPVDEKYRVRYRVDGILHASLVLPMEVGRAVVSHIKILSNLKIDEKRKPQDGRFRFEEGEKVIDLRVSTFPVVDGEKVVMRLLDKNQGLADLHTLGLTGRNYDVLLRKIKEPFGIVLMTGPTGSGKSTSLYAFLKILNQDERNIVTLEDPVEYFLEGINQSQIKPEIGYTFANGLRSILRQDPNVIMVGEIRDSETAELAIHAALTGHLVFSTLHTNSAIGSIPRLVDMGIEPFLLASSLQVVAAQRLVRRICEHCRAEMSVPPKLLEGVANFLRTVSDEEARKYGVDLKRPLRFFHGTGCEECGKTGYKGRIAIHEVLEVTDRVQVIITEKNGSEPDLKAEASKQGMLAMKHDGLLKALSGMTTLAEVERVTEGTIMVDEE
jgi:type IV pilus assembly protein PilB